MFELKPLSRDGIAGALARGERYRLLNEPGAAESIYLDVLQIDPDIQAVQRVCNVHDVPLATNIATANLIISADAV